MQLIRLPPLIINSHISFFTWHLVWICSYVDLHLLLVKSVFYFMKTIKVSFISSQIELLLRVLISIRMKSLLFHENYKIYKNHSWFVPFYHIKGVKGYIRYFTIS